MFSCWCAQDIQANWFWESLEFIPLAFRAGSRSKQRIHIFWQRRIRDNDDSTPYWFPAQTSAGAIGEDRIVLPIPPDTHRRDAKPMVLPGLPAPPEEVPLTLPGGQPVRVRPPRPQLTRRQQAAVARSQSKHLGGTPHCTKAIIRGGRIRYIPTSGFDPKKDGPDELIAPTKEKKAKAPRQKNDPKTSQQRGSCEVDISNRSMLIVCYRQHKASTMYRGNWNLHQICYCLRRDGSPLKLFEPIHHILS